VDAVCARALARGIKIPYPLTDERWEARRCFAVDPNGVALDIMSRREPARPPQE